MTDAISPMANATGLIRLLDSADEGICEIDGQGRCVYINGAGAKILGLSGDRLLGSPLDSVMHPGDGDSGAPTPSHPLSKALQAREPQSGVKSIFWHAEGHAVPVTYSFVTLSEAEGGGAMIAFRETSEYQRLDDDLRQRNEQLAEMERRRTEFIATLAHELRNPLAPIRAALDLMRKASDNVISMAQLREMMERQLEQLVRLVNDLLDIARVSSGQIVLQKEHVALQDVLQLAAEASEPLRASKLNSLVMELPAEPLHLQADPTRLTQVFTNILNNAAQYSPAGSPVTVRVDLDASQVRIDIADVGVGIARDALNRIFELFTRVGRDAKNAHAGLGIGLNLARRLVEMHDGQLVATSEGLGKGSHFVVTLPRVESQENVATPEHPAALERQRPIRAMVVDDNVDAAASLSLLLELGGHAICTAHNGPEALALAPDFKPDVVLLDIGMPGMNGYEVAQALRANRDVGHPYLVAVTGWGGAEDRLMSRSAGFDEHLTKPVDISMIELLFATLAAQRSSPGRSPPVTNGTPVDSAI